MDRSDVLFVGWGGIEGVSHYRTILPARAMGAEWVVFDMTGKPIGGEGTRTDHRVIVIQNCWYPWQLKMIEKMKQGGATVLFNCDDWIKGIGRRKNSHGSAGTFRKRDLLDTHFKIIRACHGVIASTQWIADKVRSINPNVAVARNGIDPLRYTPWMDVERDMGTIIGWAGGTGHREALQSIAGAVSDVVRAHEDVSLWIVGQDESDLFSCDTYHVDWSDMHLYPQHLACFDINLAPALDNDFYRGKSQLRLYEAWTMGTPTVASPLYNEIRSGYDGWIANDQNAWKNCLNALIEDSGLRNHFREHSLQSAKEVTIDARIGEWTGAIESLS